MHAPCRAQRRNRFASAQGGHSNHLTSTVYRVQSCRYSPYLDAPPFVRVGSNSRGSHCSGVEGLWPKNARIVGMLDLLPTITFGRTVSLIGLADMRHSSRFAVGAYMEQIMLSKMSAKPVTLRSSVISIHTFVSEGDC